MLTDALNRLRNHIDEVPSRLGNFSETELTHHLPSKWSRKEILGHLIDSAINNLKRFTDAQFADGLYVLQPYSQNKLVVVNQYQSLPITHLLTLWSSLNRQILAITEAIPADTLSQLIQVSQVGEAGDGPSTQPLSWLIEDYVVHMEHHLNTLL